MRISNKILNTFKLNWLFFPIGKNEVTNFPNTNNFKKLSKIREAFFDIYVMGYFMGYDTCYVTCNVTGLPFIIIQNLQPKKVDDKMSY